MYYIRAFGDDQECQSIGDLQETLAKHYRGRSVSVMYTPEQRLQCTRFVDVRADGSVTDSYGDLKAVDFEAIEADMKGVINI